MGTAGHANAGQGGSPLAGGHSGDAATAGRDVSSAGVTAAGGVVGSSGGTLSGEAGGAGGSDEPGGAGEAGAAGASTEPDACPDDPGKLSPGLCGCGVPDVASATQAGCQALIDKLVHRYDFEGSGTAVTDRVGTAHGSLKNASLSKLSGKGVVLFGGGTSGAYVDLPNRLLSSLSNATLEAWVTWGGGAAWQRIFDFGDSNNATPENNPGLGNTYLMLSPAGSAGHATLGFSLTGNASGQELDVVAATALPMSLAQVVVVASDADNELRLYIDGKRAGAVAWSSSLSSINDVNTWLGRSQYDHDPELSAVFHEFRVYAAALTDAEVATSFAGGPDPAFLAY